MVLDEYLLSGMTSNGLLSKVASFSKSVMHLYSLSTDQAEFGLFDPDDGKQ